MKQNKTLIPPSAHRLRVCAATASCAFASADPRREDGADLHHDQARRRPAGPDRGHHQSVREERVLPQGDEVYECGEVLCTAALR